MYITFQWLLKSYDMSGYKNPMTWKDMIFSPSNTYMLLANNTFEYNLRKRIQTKKNYDCLLILKGLSVISSTYPLPTETCQKRQDINVPITVSSL